MFMGDEEVGGKNGARVILPGIQTDFAIALDGGSRDASPTVIS